MINFKLILLFLFIHLGLVFSFSPAQNLAFAWTADEDFKFMELQQKLRKNPDGPQARNNVFAVAEYYFKQKSYFAAAKYFRRFLNLSPDNLQAVLAQAYLVRCAELSKDSGEIDTLKNQLRELFAKRSFVASFKDYRMHSWRSASGNLFKISEWVDRMEISMNETPFYTLKL